MACNRWPEVCGTSSYARLQASLGMADASTASEQERRHPADRLKNDLTKRQTNSRESLKNLESHNEHCEWVSCRENRRLCVGKLGSDSNGVNAWKIVGRLPYISGAV